MRQIHRNERIRFINEKISRIRNDFNIIDEVTFDLTNKSETKLKTDENRNEKKKQR